MAQHRSEERECGQLQSLKQAANSPRTAPGRCTQALEWARLSPVLCNAMCRVAWRSQCGRRQLRAQLIATSAHAFLRLRKSTGKDMASAWGALLLATVLLTGQASEWAAAGLDSQRPPLQSPSNSMRLHTPPGSLQAPGPARASAIPSPAKVRAPPPCRCRTAL